MHISRIYNIHIISIGFRGISKRLTHQVAPYNMWINFLTGSWPEVAAAFWPSCWRSQVHIAILIISLYDMIEFPKCMCVILCEGSRLLTCLACLCTRVWVWCPCTRDLSGRARTSARAKGYNGKLNYVYLYLRVICTARTNALYDRVSKHTCSMSCADTFN